MLLHHSKIAENTVTCIIVNYNKLSHNLCVTKFAVVVVWFFWGEGGAGVLVCSTVLSMLSGLEIWSLGLNTLERLPLLPGPVIW